MPIIKIRQCKSPNIILKAAKVFIILILPRGDLQGAHIAIVPGDPGRVEGLAKALGTNAKHITSNREYTSYLTNIDGENVLICSTGMGGPSTAICLEELARMGIDTFIRFGTTGAIQKHIQPGDVIINDSAVRLDGTSTHYAPIEFPAVASNRVTNALREAAIETNAHYHIGTSVSSDTFWPGQKRYDSFTGYVPRRLQGTMKEWQTLGALNYEMETSTLFVVSRVFGLDAGAVCAVVINRAQTESIAKKDGYYTAYNQMIEIVKGAVRRLK